MSDGLWRTFAPTYCIMTDKNKEKRTTEGLRQSPVLTLEEKTVMPVFTSVDSAEDFAEIFYAEEKNIRPSIGPVDAFTLVHWADHAQEGHLREFVFDPEATSAGRWTDPRATMSLSHYRRFAAELDSGLEKLFAEACAALGYGPEGPPLESPWPQEERAWVMDWCWSRVEEVAEDARARASEWELSADPEPS